MGEQSRSLRRVICLIDASAGPSKGDLHIWDSAQAAGRKLMVVLTKVDLCHAEDLHSNVVEVLTALRHLDTTLVWPYVHAVSAEHGLGMRELRASIAAESAVCAQAARAR